MLYNPNPQSARSTEERAPAPPADSISPSLLGSIGAVNAYELKFLVPDSLAGQIEHWAGGQLTLDPHADAALGNAYRIHSLYLDTAELDIYHRTPSFKRRKFRLRRYGNEPGLFLERKTKSGERVSKRRTRIPDAEVGRFQDALADPAWGGSWFHRRVLTRRLEPTCQITYDRVAYVGAAAEGPLRLTFDRRVLCIPTRTWTVGDADIHRLLFPDQVVMEFKYRSALPALFKRLIQEFRLNPEPASKYRSCIEAWQLHNIPGLTANQVSFGGAAREAG